MDDLHIQVLGSSFERYSVLPVLSFELGVEDPKGRPVHALALRAQIRLSPASRRYSEEEKLGLRELFGEPRRWEETVKSFFWCDASTVVGAFVGSTKLTLTIPLSTDLELASTKYFSSLVGGEVPLEFLFSGTVFRSIEGHLMVEPISWSVEASYRMPVSVLRGALDAHFPGIFWLGVSRETLESLREFKVRRALPTWDSAVSALLEVKEGALSE